MTSVKTFDQQLLVPYTDSAKNHKLILLPNGILTLLISDPAEDIASIALCVASGAHNDPDEIPGLAHFCEHLLLLGSRKYPNPNTFHDTLTKAGGSRNAFTTGEQTCYFLQVPSNSIHVSDTGEEQPIFNHVVDIFADSFKDPIFPESMFEKEIYAIDNEHQSNKSLTGRILYHGLRLISNPDHKFSRFATGNFFTLNDLPKINKVKVSEELMRYYQENYVPEKMTLVIKSSQSLNHLQKLAIQNFGDLRNNNSQKKTRPRIFGKKSNEKDGSQKPSINIQDLEDFDILSTWEYDSTPFTDAQLHNCVFIKSSKNPVLRLFFPLKPSHDASYELYKSAFVNIAGDEGTGSLDHILKSRGYSTGLSAYAQNLNRSDDVIVIEIKLTATGVKKFTEIISVVLNAYKAQTFNNAKVLGRYLSELESIDLLNYLHQDNVKTPMQEVSYYAQVLQKNMKSLNPKNILKGSRNWDSQSSEQDRFWVSKGEELLRFVDKFFSVRNLRFALLSNLDSDDFAPILSTASPATKNDEFFNFDYSVCKFDPSKLNIDCDYKFKFVHKNQFIPKYALDHQLLQAQLKESSEQSSNSSLGFTTKSEWSTTEAELIQKSDRYEIWTKAENSKKFSSKVFLSFDLISTSLRASPIRTMCAEILSEIVKLRLSNDLYASELLNYTWEINASLKGDSRFGFTVSGYSGGIDVLLSILIDTFTDILSGHTITNDEFRKARVCVRSRYSELEQNTSLGLAITGLLVALEENIWEMEDRIEALDEVDLKSFKKFSSDFERGSKFLKLFVHGDFKAFETYSTIINRASGHLTAEAPSRILVQPSTYLLQPGSSYIVKRKGPDNDPMSSISLFIQTGPRSDQYAFEMTKLLSYLMSRTLIPDLRFKRQLGYAVLGGTRILRSTIGIHISIMSGTFTPQYLQKKIHEYLVVWEKSYDSMTDEEFARNVTEPYFKNFKKNITASGGPESLTSEMLPSVGSSNITEAGESMKSHKWLRDLILNDAYGLELDSSLSNKGFMSSLTKSTFLNFFRERISINSPKRAQLSVMITSPLSAEETQQQLIRLQLEAFLKMNGLRISSDKLDDIVRTTKGNPVYLMRDLFKYFISQGGSLRLVSVVLKEILKSVSESVKQYKCVHSDSTESGPGMIESCEIDDLTKFHASSHVYYLKK